MKSSDTALYKAVNNGLKLKEMSEEERRLAIKTFVYKIIAVTGIKLPDDPIFIITAFEEVEALIAENEKFAGLTFSEIVTAARFDMAGNLGEVTEYWNNNFNLKFLCQILTKWIEHKRKVLAKIDLELMTKNLFEADTTAEYSDDQALQFALDNWNLTKDYMFIESRVYELLCNQGKLQLSAEEKARINNQAIEKVNWIFRKYFNSYTQEAYYNHCRIIVAMKISVAEYFAGAPVAETNTGRNSSEYDQESYNRKLLNCL